MSQAPTVVERAQFERLADEVLRKRDCTLWRARGPADRLRHGGNFVVLYGGRAVFASDDLDVVRRWLDL